MLVHGLQQMWNTLFNSFPGMLETICLVLRSDNMNIGLLSLHFFLWFSLISAYHSVWFGFIVKMFTCIIRFRGDKVTFIFCFESENYNKRCTLNTIHIELLTFETVYLFPIPDPVWGRRPAKIMHFVYW
jgi:hypothetical protein